MSASEGSSQKSIWTALGRACRLFRVNTGKGYVTGGGKPARLPDGSVLIPNGRPVALGLGQMDGSPVVGTSDLIGFTPVLVTADMVGRTLPVFTAIECKAEVGGRQSTEQKKFVAFVIKHGGIAGFANSVESAQKILSDWYSAMRQRLL